MVNCYVNISKGSVKIGWTKNTDKQRRKGRCDNSFSEIIGVLLDTREEGDLLFTMEEKVKFISKQR